MASSGGSLPTFVARRLLITVLLLFLISLGVYSLILIIPGNPAIALAGGTKATPAEIAKITAQLHLNEGFFAQYWRWLKAALHGNLGNSLFNNETVSSGIAARFPVTLSVAAGGMIVAILIGLPAGILSGLHQGTARDRLVTVGSSVAVAIPDFWLAMLLVILFAVKLEWLPALGYTPFTQSPGRMVSGPLAAMVGTRHRRLSSDRTPGARRPGRHLGPGLHAHRGGEGPQSPHGGR